MARRERMESGQRIGPAGSGDQVGPLYHGGASSGRVVEADFEYSGDRAALGARRRDPAGYRGGSQDYASRGGLSGAGRSVEPGSGGGRRRPGRAFVPDGM